MQRIPIEESALTTNLLQRALYYCNAIWAGECEEGTGGKMISMNILLIVFGVIFGLVVLFALGTSGFVFFNVFRLFNRVLKDAGQHQDESGQAAHVEKKRKALELLAQQPAGSPAFKCRGCGATVDSTAELAPDGRVRCNYCNQWTCIYQ